MSLNSIRQRSSIISAIRECQSLGRDRFLARYGFGRAKEYFLVYEGQLFDSKAIIGAAHGKEHPDRGPLTSAQFSGGEATVRRKLNELGFEVRKISFAAGGIVDAKSAATTQALHQAERHLADAREFDASSEEDARDRVIASIVRRRGQPAFRNSLLLAYGHRCAVSDCDVAEVLEAAHIKPYRGPHTNAVVNGLLLRADLHTLFDLGLMAIDPQDLKIWIAPLIQETDYGQFQRKELQTPIDSRQHPDPHALGERFREFCDRFGVK